MKAHHTLVPDALLDRVAQRFRVLGDASRLAIVRLLVARNELSVGEVVEGVGMSQANVSKHLRLLLDAGIVSRRREGTSAYYAVIDDSIERLCALVCDRIEEQVQLEAAALSRA
ncbi:MAG: metalloregulator ArsR/SmtB family transcription factor [Chloroflexi bacterium]|nr:metalloregulator ArsR/SmtB family transcription factor [Chloroflexota bacterium]MDA1146970.1 metalloregulator ArsR/SmtB family transcription factor [Chloroflexota bacterium]